MNQTTRVMKKFVLTLWLAIACLAALPAIAQSDYQPLDAVVGRAFRKLSETYLVSGKTLQSVPTLWINAELGQVQEPIGKNTPAFRVVTKLVPTDSGLVIRFYGPQEAGQTQKVWRSFNDKDARHFETVAALTDQQFVGIVGEYGKDFDPDVIDRLFFAPAGKSGPSRAGSD